MYCLLFVVCCVLFVNGWLLCVVRLRCSFFCVCRLSFVVCCMLYVLWCLVVCVWRVLFGDLALVVVCLLLLVGLFVV